MGGVNETSVRWARVLLALVLATVWGVATGCGARDNAAGTGACHHAPEFSGDAAVCVAARYLLTCQISDGNTEVCLSDSADECPNSNLPAESQVDCSSACAPTEYPILCRGAAGYLAVPAFCRALPPQPGGGGRFACCPCEG